MFICHKQVRYVRLINSCWASKPVQLVDCYDVPVTAGCRKIPHTKVK